MLSVADRRAPTEGDQFSHADAVIADANRLNGESVAWCLNAYGGFRNVTAVSTAAELLQTIRSVRPRIVLLAERLMTSVLRELFSELAVRLGETRVVVFADQMTDRQLDLVVNNRVAGLVSRQDSMRTISDLLIQAASGQVVVSDQLAEKVQLLPDGTFRCIASTKLRKLTDRQWDVLIRIADGGRVAEVAAALEITEKAVEAHKYRIMRAIGATDRVDLCRWAIREGLIEA